MNEQVQQIRLIHKVSEAQFDGSMLPFPGMGSTEWLISFFSNRATQLGFGAFDVGARKDMAEIVREDAKSSLFSAHKAELEAIAAALDGP